MLQSVTGVALEQLGSVTKFREILDLNPDSLPFELPPQVQQGIDLANQVLALTGSDFKVPSIDDLALETGLTTILGNLGLNTEKTSEAVSEVTSTVGVKDLLQSIEWLL